MADGVVVLCGIATHDASLYEVCVLPNHQGHGLIQVVGEGFEV